jgi:hypothetical protein
VSSVLALFDRQSARNLPVVQQEQASNHRSDDTQLAKGLS